MADNSITAAKYEEVERLRQEAQNEIAAKLEVFFESVLEHSYKYSGAGSYFAQFHKTLARIDRYGIRTVTQNNEHAGLTFMTRPKLNLTSGNLKQNRLLNMLNTKDPKSIQFMIRMLLDTKLAREDPTCINLVHESPFLDANCPFMTPLTNCLESISGFPSYNLETYTTEGGFFSEDLTFAVGADRNRKSFDLQLSFVDIQGGIISALIQMWMEYIAALTVGEMIAYSEDVENQRLNYTVSLYRFLLDPSKRYITRWCKCTGGFPISRPSGAVFDMTTSEIYVEAAKKFSVTFKFNHMGIENDPIILKEFNMLVKRYNQFIEYADAVGNSNHLILDTTPESNYVGIPYIVPTAAGPMLQFRIPTAEMEDDTLNEELLQMHQDIETTKSTLDTKINAILQSPTTVTPTVPVQAGDITYV